MSPSTSPLFRKVTDHLLRHGILLESDAHLPSVVSLVAGEPVPGSWWGHPRGQDIFAAVRHLHDHGDCVEAKLVSGKVTFVHRELWASLLAVATCGEPWQLQDLSRDALVIRQIVEERGEVSSEELGPRVGYDGKELGARIRELERRLLIHTRMLQAGRGRHSKVCQTWAHWSETQRRERSLGGRQSTRRAKGIFEVMLQGQNEQYGGDGRLPWR